MSIKQSGSIYSGESCACALLTKKKKKKKKKKTHRRHRFNFFFRWNSKLVIASLNPGMNVLVQFNRSMYICIHVHERSIGSWLFVYIRTLVCFLKLQRILEKIFFNYFSITIWSNSYETIALLYTLYVLS